MKRNIIILVSIFGVLFLCMPIVKHIRSQQNLERIEAVIKTQNQDVVKESDNQTFEYEPKDGFTVRHENGKEIITITGQEELKRYKKASKRTYEKGEELVEIIIKRKVK